MNEEENNQDLQSTSEAEAQTADTSTNEQVNTASTSDNAKVDDDGFPIVDEVSDPTIEEDEVDEDSKQKQALADIEKKYSVKRIYSGETWTGWKAVIPSKKGDYKLSIVKPKIGTLLRANSAYSYTDAKGNSHFENDKLINMLLKQTAVIDPEGKNMGRNLSLDSFDSFTIASSVIELISFCLASFQNS